MTLVILVVALLLMGWSCGPSKIRAEDVLMRYSG